MNNEPFGVKYHQRQPHNEAARSGATNTDHTPKPYTLTELVK